MIAGLSRKLRSDRAQFLSHPQNDGQIVHNSITSPEITDRSSSILIAAELRSDRHQLRISAEFRSDNHQSWSPQNYGQIINFSLRRITVRSSILVSAELRSDRNQFSSPQKFRLDRHQFLPRPRQITVRPPSVCITSAKNNGQIVINFDDVPKNDIQIVINFHLRRKITPFDIVCQILSSFVKTRIYGQIVNNFMMTAIFRRKTMKNMNI